MKKHLLARFDLFKIIQGIVYLKNIFTNRLPFLEQLKSENNFKPILSWCLMSEFSSNYLDPQKRKSDHVWKITCPVVDVSILNTLYTQWSFKR